MKLSDVKNHNILFGQIDYNIYDNIRFEITMDITDKINENYYSVGRLFDYKFSSSSIVNDLYYDLKIKLRSYLNESI